MTGIPSRLVAGAFWLVVAGLLVVGCAGQPYHPDSSADPAATVDLAAANVAFDKSELTVPAEQLFAIDFSNNDSVAHNVSIRGVSGGDEVGAVVNGGSATTYVFGPLPAGTYKFVCDIHPEMTGTLTVEEASK